MTRGGSKPGERRGGRQKGGLNKTTLARMQAIDYSGLTPLAYMLSVLRDDHSSKEQKRWAANAAAPYMHPRLQTTTVQGEGGGAIEVKIVNYAAL